MDQYDALAVAEAMVEQAFLDAAAERHHRSLEDRTEARGEPGSPVTEGEE